MPILANTARFVDRTKVNVQRPSSKPNHRGGCTPPLSLLSTPALAAALYPVSSSGWLRNRARYLARVMFNPGRDRQWRNFLTGDMGMLWSARLRLALKVHRSYLRRDLNTAERLTALKSHYSILPEFLSPEARAEIYCGGVTLLRLTDANSGRLLDLRLVYSERAEKEGELTLVVKDVETDLDLISLTFCLAHEGVQRVAWIGGLQSSSDGRMRDLIHDVSKEMHGLRPKALAVWCLQEMASFWLVTNLRAVADPNHASMRWRWSRRFTTSYDEFWEECGGDRHADGNWNLPLKMAVRSREELKPSRRKAHELRYAMLGNLRPIIHSALATLAPGAALGRQWQEFQYKGARSRSVPENIVASPAPKAASSRKLATVAA